MATYVYYCPTCRVEKTIQHPMTDKHTEQCGNCNVTLVKAFYAPSVTFKGGGWGHSNN